MSYLSANLEDIDMRMFRVVQGVYKKIADLILIAIFILFPLLTMGAENREILLATTTSTVDSGLLDLLIPDFEKKSNYKVKILAVGSGEAIALGKRGEVDIILVHAPSAEEGFMNEGYGARRRLIMHNDFIIVGPHNDPAGIKGLKSAKDALRRIAERGAIFISRADNSGTHMLEKRLWSEVMISPGGRDWYKEAGQGMGETLNLTAEKSGYTISDRGTFLAMRPSGLEILVEGDRSLLNAYHVIEVNSGRFSKVNSNGAKALSDYLVSEETQMLIKGFGLERFGQPLFFPDAIK